MILPVLSSIYWSLAVADVVMCKYIEHNPSLYVSALVGHVTVSASPTATDSDVDENR